MSDINKLFFELIQVDLGTLICLSFMPFVKLRTDAFFCSLCEHSRFESTDDSFEVSAYTKS